MPGVFSYANYGPVVLQCEIVSFRAKIPCEPRRCCSVMTKTHAQRDEKLCIAKSSRPRSVDTIGRKNSAVTEKIRPHRNGRGRGIELPGNGMHAFRFHIG